VNNPSNVQNSSGLLKNAYSGKGPIAQMSENMPIMAVLRMKRDALKNK